jgi:DNA-binding transcriptional regulator YiaG
MVDIKNVSQKEIQRLREKLGLSQDELANALGLAGKNVVSRWETGERNPSEALRRLFSIWLKLPTPEARRLLEKFRACDH